MTSRSILEIPSTVTPHHKKTSISKNTPHQKTTKTNLKGKKLIKVDFQMRNDELKWKNLPFIDK
jgi:hypothetical protein